ncbi:MAG: hypothetical protein ABIP57_09660 [Jatrophihabitantaceae bacterium]
MTRLGDGASIIAAFVWLGMVLAISFMEAPLKFRAPGITLPLGLGIGRLVFRALNVCEAVLAVALVTSTGLGDSRAVRLPLAGVLAAVLLVQVVGVRPALDRRARAIIAGGDRTPSRGHVTYIGLEVVKVALLVTVGLVTVSGELR